MTGDEHDPDDAGRVEDPERSLERGLPRFVRPIGRLDRSGDARGGPTAASGGPTAASGGPTAGCLPPFEGVLRVGVERRHGLPPGLTYLALPELVAQGLGGREPRGGDTPHGTRADSTPRGTTGAADDGPRTVSQVLRAPADGPTGGSTDDGDGESGAGRRGPGSTAGDDAADATAAAGGAAPGASGPGVASGSGSSTGGPIRELRRLDSTSTVPGDGPAASPPRLASLARPRTVVTTTPLPTRDDGPSRAPVGDRGPSAPGRAPTDTPDAGSSRRDGPSPHEGSDSPAARPGSDGRTGTDDPTPAWTDSPVATGAGSDRDAGPGVGGARPSMDVTSHVRRPGSSPEGSGPSALDPGGRGRPGAARSVGSGAAVPLTVVEGPDGSPTGQGHGPAATSEPGTGATGPASTAGSAGAAGAPRTDDGQEPGFGGAFPPAPGEAGGAESLPEDLSLDGGGPGSRFVEALYRELSRIDRIERRRRGI